MVWEGQTREVRLNAASHLDLSDVFLFQDATDDPKLYALQSLWYQIYSGQYTCPSGLKVSTSDFKSCQLGDFLAFMLAYGASPSTGTHRLLGLVLIILRQIGVYFTSDKQKKILVPCDKKHLPLVKPIQRKRKNAERDLGEDHDPEVMEDVRLRCIAYFKDTYVAFGQTRSKSLTLVTDAADVSGANITLFYAWSPVLASGAMLPHQAPSSLTLKQFMIAYVFQG